MSASAPPSLARGILRLRDGRRLGYCEAGDPQPAHR